MNDFTKETQPHLPDCGENEGNILRDVVESEIRKSTSPKSTSKSKIEIEIKKVKSIFGNRNRNQKPKSKSGKSKSTFFEFEIDNAHLWEGYCETWTFLQQGKVDL